MENYQSLSDQSLKKLISTYASEMKEKNCEGMVSVTPSLFLQNKNLYLEFRIGIDKKYLIKDLQEFKTCMQEQTVTQYGNSFKCVHTILNFSESTKKYVKFIMSHLPDEKYSERVRYLKLEGYVLDDFFNVYDSDRIHFRDEKTKFYLDIHRSNPQITINLLKNKTNDNYTFTAEGWSSVFVGGEGLYIINEHDLYICNEEYSKDMHHILPALCKYKKGLFVDKNDLSVLNSTVLNPVKIHSVFITDAKLEAFEAPPLMARLYLDLVDKNLITAKLVFYYGNYKHDAFKEKNLSQSSDLEQEYFCEELLKRYFIVGDKYCYAQDDDAIFNIINGGIDHLNKYMEIYATEKFKAVSIKPPPRMQVSINVSKGFLNLDVDFEYTEELEEILNSYHSKKQYHRLNSGEFITLPNSLEIFDIAKNKVPAFKAMYIDAMLKSDECVKLVRDDTFKKMVRDIKYVADADFPVPAQLDGIIRGYQKQGFVWLKTLASYGFCGILADDMGLGKTLQVIALLLSENLDKPAIIVCPASLMLNWQSEINRFAKTLKSIVIDGNDRQDKINSINNYDIVITSYDLLRRDLNEYLKYEFSFQIIDEAQYIKNFYTKNSESVKAINASHRFALTGTPIENKLSELWSIFDFLMPSYLESYKKFREKYEIPIARDNDKNAQVALKRLISPFVLRRLKKDVLKELPERTEKVLFSVMDKAQRDLYDANLSLVKSDILRLADINGNKISILAMLTRLRQLCCAPSLIYHDYNANNAKLETCMSIIESSIANGHKILLFSQFTSMLKIIAEELDANSISYYMLTGQTPTKERLNMVNSFNEDDTNIFLISLKAGGTGLNLTGADVVIHYDPWWNVSVQNQATDRTHRIGQKNSVSVYKLIAKDTIEEKILRLQQYKANIADMIISEGGVSLGSLTKDDIMEILS